MYIGALGAAKLLNAYVRPRWDAVTMVAIAGAESSWNTTAVSSTNDYGVWQINNQAWPELFSLYNWWDPVDNAKMMDHVYRYQGVTAWTTYTSGAYLRYWNEAQQAVNAAGGQGYSGGGSGPPSGGGIGNTSDIGAAMQTIARAFETIGNQDLYWAHFTDKMW